MKNIFEETLFLITARGGSKGIPGKNIKPLCGKPLIYYTIDVARELVPDHQICLSTDSEEIIESAKAYNLLVPFKRPDELASDTSGSHEVIIHALNFYQINNRNFKNIILLQPTSPFRTSLQIKEAFNLFSHELDMVVSVMESDTNPYYNLFEEDEGSYLKKSKEGNYIRRQDCPKVYQYNGAIYIINSRSISGTPLHRLKKVKKYVMDSWSSVDIDSIEDWLWAQYLLEKKIVKK